MCNRYSDENLEFYDQVQNVYKKLDFDNKTPENQKKIKGSNLAFLTIYSSHIIFSLSQSDICWV
jgi:hypothetical protein